MNESFISKRDRIIVSAIEIISESGLSSLSIKSLSQKENMSESLIYKYFGGLSEVIVEVIEYFVKFDKSIMHTINVKKSPNMDKIRCFFDTYGTYYDNYIEITAIILNYEELLHNTGTRELITNCIIDRNEFLTGLIKNAIEAGEISNYFTASELSDMLISIMNGLVLSRRVMYHKECLKKEIMDSVNKILALVEIK